MKNEAQLKDSSGTNWNTPLPTPISSHIIFGIAMNYISKATAVDTRQLQK